jgi:hypothetical protein
MTDDETKKVIGLFKQCLEDYLNGKVSILQLTFFLGIVNGSLEEGMDAAVLKLINDVTDLLMRYLNNRIKLKRFNTTLSNFIR